VKIIARSKKQNEKMREDRKRMISEGAVKLFASNGFFATTITDIAKEVSMAQGLVYHYYKSKDDIYLEVISHALDMMNEAVQGLRQSNQPADEKIKAALIELFKTIQTSDRFNQTVKIITNARNSTAIPEPVKQILDEKRDIPYQALAEIFSIGQRDGTVVEGDPYALSVVFWTFINGLAVYKSTREADAPFPDPSILFSTFLKTRSSFNTLL